MLCLYDLKKAAHIGETVRGRYLKWHRNKRRIKVPCDKLYATLKFRHTVEPDECELKCVMKNLPAVDAQLEDQSDNRFATV